LHQWCLDIGGGYINEQGSYHWLGCMLQASDLHEQSIYMVSDGETDGWMVYPDCDGGVVFCKVL
jgi:hypothetical protein